MLPSLLTLMLAAEVSLQPGAAPPGDLILISVNGTKTPPTGSLGSWELTFIPAGDTFQAMVGLPLDQKAGELELSVVLGAGRAKELITGTFQVLEGKFKKSELTVSKKFTSPSKKDQQHSARDQQAFNEAFDRDFEPWTFNENFAWPRPDVITGTFGDKRMYNGKLKSQHYGLDLDGERGDFIRAANDGEVVMVRECFGSGNTVVLHHGGRLFTTYFHMTKFDVKQGEFVKRGQLLGRVGMTGRVTGPHLHFGVKIDGRWVNPLSLLSLDFAPFPIEHPVPEPSDELPVPP